MINKPVLQGRFLRIFLDGSTYALLKEKSQKSNRRIAKEAALRVEESLSRVETVSGGDLI